MKQILILHGPNLNLLGVREPEIYGEQTLGDINQRLIKAGQKIGLQVRAQQSNHEGALIDSLHEAGDWAAGVILNPGGYSHTSVAIRDAVAATNIPVIEVHLSNIYAREEFRRHSLIAPVCKGTIAGFGWRSYLLALHAMIGLLEEEIQ